MLRNQYVGIVGKFDHDDNGLRTDKRLILGQLTESGIPRS